MKRKMYISLALVLIMLMNCIMPLFTVNAAGVVDITLNSKLYAAVKESLSNQEITFGFNDITHTITLNDTEMSKITRLDLNESDISDLTGLDAFTSVTHLELSGNKLSKTSNLSVLNNLSNLDYLDLSTNNLEDVSEISSLINNVDKNGTVVLSGQTVTIVEKMMVDSSEDSNNDETASYELPQILELAGYIKSAWIHTDSVAQDPYHVAPSVKDMPMYVNSNNKNIVVNIADENGAGYLGLLEVSIYIYDDKTEANQANNINKASENILNGSRFYLYYVVYDSATEAITTEDTNLYYAIKEQLTGGQTVNPQLASYPYAVDGNGNEVYVTYTVVSVNGNEETLAIKGNSGYETVYTYNTKTKVLLDTDNNAVNADIKQTVAREVDANGEIKEYKAYEICAATLTSGRDLYIRAYDVAKTFIISDVDLVNKITSLVLNNKQIRSLSGLEYFVGLTSNLNVSHNYLSDIDPLYALEDVKADWENQLREAYEKRLNGPKDSLSVSSKKLFDAMSEIEAIEKQIKEITDKVAEIIAAAGKLETEDADKLAEEINKKVEEITNVMKPLYDSTNENGEVVDGLLTRLNKVSDKVDLSLPAVYNKLYRLYDIYNKEYKLTSLLSDELNYMNTDEYEAYVAKIKDRKQAEALVNAQIAYVSGLESAKALSTLDVSLLEKAFENEISMYRESDKDTAMVCLKKALEEIEYDRNGYVSILNKFKEISLYSEMANYCLIKRMNEETPRYYCYAEEYLKGRIEEFEFEEIPCVLETSLLNFVEGNEYVDTSVFDSELLGIYLKYETTVSYYGSVRVYRGYDIYKELIGIDMNVKPITSAQIIALAEKKAGNDVTLNSDTMDKVLAKVNISSLGEAINKYEWVDGGRSGANAGILYDQLVSLTNKLLKSNTQRYIVLPRLKVLDISYNASLESLENITKLDKLVKLNASYDYIADITNIDWSSLKNLRDLNLSYNYISDISKVLDLPKLRVLNLSNNLIAGELKISADQYTTLFDKLTKLDLSGNQITDISSLLVYLDRATNGNFANYLANPNTIDMLLNNQNIEINVEDEISLAEYPTTVNVELPKIFTQLLAIDTDRTAFGETSQNGRVESEGTYVTVNTRDAGDKEAVVVVKAMSGNGAKVDTCVGEGTKATIKYKVVEGTTTPVNPGTDTPANPGTDTPANPGTDTPANPGTDTPANPGTDTPTTEEPAISEEVVKVSELGYTIDDEYVTDVKAKTPVSEFKKVLLNGKSYDVVVKKDGEVITSGNMATGMYAQVVDSEGKVVKDENGDLVVFEIIVKGDVNGDGLANSLDSVIIKAARNEVVSLTVEEKAAADINNDEKVNVADSKLLLYHRAEVTGYNLNYTK